MMVETPLTARTGAISAIAVVAAAGAGLVAVPPAHAQSAPSHSPLRQSAPALAAVPTAAAPNAIAPIKAAPVAAAAASPSYTVVKGDTISHIAKRTGVSSASIISANGLNSKGLIKIGQVLTIPTAGGATTGAAKPSAASGGQHVVVAGETVSGLAKKYGTTTSAIISANGLSAKAMIRIGQRLTIPGGATTTALVGDTFLGRTYPDSTVSAANINKAALLNADMPSKKEMQRLVAQVAREMGVSPALAQAVAFQESGFKMSAVSPANAVGVMQVIPSAGAWASQLVGRQLDLLNPRDNVVAGVAILKALIRTSPDLSTAIASYYQGQTSVRKNGMYNDTRRYVASVQTLMSTYA